MSGNGVMTHATTMKAFILKIGIRHLKDRPRRESDERWELVLRTVEFLQIIRSNVQRTINSLSGQWVTTCQHFKDCCLVFKEGRIVYVARL